MCAKDPSRYRPPSGSQTEFQPGSGERVLLNKLGLTAPRERDAFEHRALLSAQETYLSIVEVESRFTAKIICEMHRLWLGRIYDWAGEYRTVNLTKGGFTWPPASIVAANMVEFEKGPLRAHTPCTQGPLESVARSIAIVHAELLLIHPFREGNGRLARWLADLMAYQAGLPAPKLRLAGPGSKGRFVYYVNCVQQGYVQNYAALAAFFLEGLEFRLDSLR